MKQKPNIIFGIRTVIEAVKSGKEIEKLLIKKGLQGETFNELFSMVRRLQIPFQFVPIQKIERITRKNHQGVVAFISQVSYHNIEEIVPKLYEEGKNPLIIVLDGITDVRNFGAIARTAECAGIDAIVIPNKGSAQVNADAIKTSAGALHSIPICRVSHLSNTVRFLRESGLRIVAATEKTRTDYYSIDYTVPTAIIMGAEDKGVSASILKIADEMAKIPVKGNIQSLNVSVAAAVVIYEALRQRMSVL